MSDKKPAWAIEKDRRRKQGPEPVWLFGLHAVRDALMNPARQRQRLILTRNAAARLEEAVSASGMTAEIADPRKFPAPLDPGSVHQGAALQTLPLAEQQALEAQAASDPELAGRMERVKAQIDAAVVDLPALPPLPEDAPAPWWRRAWLPAVGLALAAAVALFVVLPPTSVLTIDPVVCPWALVTAPGWVSVLPVPVAVKVTASPGIGLSFASRSVIVTVEVATPYAVTLAGETLTSD